MSLFSPVTRTTYGLNVYLKGFKWLREHPKYFLILFIPVVIGIFVLFGGLAAITTYNEAIIDWILFDRPESWFLLMFWWIAWILLNVSIYALSLVTAMLFVNIIASPFYEIVSVAVERDITGRDEGSLSLMDNIKVIFVEIKKVAFILIVSIVLLCIPVVNVITIFVEAFLIGWDFFDYPVARRNFSFRERLKIVMGDFWAVMGMGLWLVIPFVQVLLMPLAVAGGTILGVEALNKDK